MSLRDETSARIDHVLSAVRVVAFEHHLGRLADLAQSERFVRDELVGAEAIVQLNHLNVARLHACVVERSLRRQLAHLVAHDFDTIGALAERALQIRRHLQRQDLDRFRLEFVRAHKLFAR